MPRSANERPVTTVGFEEGYEAGERQGADDLRRSLRALLGAVSDERVHGVDRRVGAVESHIEDVVDDFTRDIALLQCEL